MKYYDILIAIMLPASPMPCLFKLELIYFFSSPLYYLLWPTAIVIIMLFPHHNMMVFWCRVALLYRIFRYFYIHMHLYTFVYVKASNLIFNHQLVLSQLSWDTKILKSTAHSVLWSLQTWAMGWAPLHEGLSYPKCPHCKCSSSHLLNKPISLTQLILLIITTQL